MTSRDDIALPTDRSPHSFKTLILWFIAAVSVIALCIILGNWQLAKMDQKRLLNRKIRAHATAVPIAAPGPIKWSSSYLRREEYRHVRVTGKFLNRDQTLVHGTSRLGYGYWVMTPMKTSRGFIVFVNRGYIPGSWSSKTRSRLIPEPTGTVTVTGYLRLTELRGGFLRRNQPRHGQWYSRDVIAIGTSLHLPTHIVAPYFIDADAATQIGHWPVAGLTVTHFRNNYLSYATGWYVIALTVFLAAAFFFGREWHSRRRRSR